MYQLLKKELPGFLCFLMVLCLAGIVASCGRKTAEASLSADSQGLDLTEKTVRNALVEDFPEWQSVYMPVKIRVDGPVSISLSGRATMIRGSRLHISFRMLGLEVASLYADNDSVFMADKYHKILFAESTSAVAHRYGVSLTNIQDLLLGRPALIGVPDINSSNVNKFLVARVNGDEWSVYSETPDAQYNYVMSALNREGRAGIYANSFAVTPKGSRISLVWDYSQPSLTPAGVLPADGSIRIPAGHDRDMTIDLEWGMKDARWNTSQEIRWRRPTGYREVDASMLLQLLKPQK